jgi:hypothetical protein
MVMKINNDEFLDFFNSTQYKKLLVEACTQLRLELNENFPEILYEYDEKKLGCAGLALTDLRNTMEESSQTLIKFIILKYNEDPANLDKKISANSRINDEDEPKLIKTMPMYRNFLLGYIVEFTILNRNPSKIIEYLKCVRIPNSSGYANFLKKWHLRATDTEP